MATMNNFGRTYNDPDKSNPDDDDHEEDGPVTWDAEEDHLLSYFLGDTSSSNGGASNIPALTQGYKQSQAPSQGMRMPSTPAVQFYPTSKSNIDPAHPVPSAQTSQHKHKYSSAQQQHPPPIISSSSSGSSLSSMAATLVHGGPMLPQHHIHGSHPQHSISPLLYNSTSPISPAAIIGNGQENLMLPPPPRHAVDKDRQNHFKWLQQVNSMAMQVQSFTQPQQVNSMAIHTQYSQQQQQQQQQQQGDTMAMQQFSQPQQILPPGYGGYPLAPSCGVTRSMPSAESEEKRAKRLARNRESARQSRRRKKEHLAALGNKVNQLQDILEEARRSSLSKMDMALRKKRASKIAELVDGGVISIELLQQVLQETSPNSPVKQGAIRFQYIILKQALLPKYEEFILWLTLREEAFYSKGKDEKAKADSQVGDRAVTSGRFSSKQIGEDLTKILQESDDGLEVDADDLAKLWPMFCFEHAISVDQEDKLIQFYRRSVQNQNLNNDRLQMADMTRMVSNMNKGMSFQSHAVGMRSENTLLRTLTPEQAAKYLDWYASNKERCQRVLRERAMIRDLGESEEAKTMNEMCKRVDDALRLPVTDVTCDGEDGSMDQTCSGP